MNSGNITIHSSRKFGKEEKRPSKNAKDSSRSIQKRFSFSEVISTYFKQSKKTGIPPKKIKLDELHTFANQLSVLLQSGVPLLSALSILADQMHEKPFRSVILAIIGDINRGTTFHEGLARFPTIFPNIFVSLVKVAEISGGLPDILRQISEYLHKQDKTQKRIKSATAYPKFVFFFFLFILIGVVYGLVPKFQETFASYDAELPVLTEILLAVSNAALKYIYIELGLVVSGIVAWKRFLKTSKGIYFQANLVLKIPVIGNLISKDILSRFCRTLRVLLKSGVPLVTGLEVAAETAQDVIYTSALHKIRRGIISGDTFAKQLAIYPQFPAMVVKMIATGEQSGSLDKMLLNIADLYDSELDAKIAGLSTIIEPVLMVGLGIIAVFVILALYLPIFKLGSIM
ncbi:MAG: type II secretion system F family protein [Deferribacteres bacterium]|nr:type II secretion system F family protein [candidate division KSB1 bacterium]MCB9501296.1 type II secretion system F family protein [Deferribacteres bacterium]